MQKKVCLIIGDPIDHSLSPVMFGAAFKYLGIENKYVFSKKCVKAGDTKEAVDEMKAKNYRGLTCTMPHKIEVMQYLDEIDEKVSKIGAVNTVVNNNGKLKGYNTDYIGITDPLKKIIDLKKKEVALIGAGGASRAAIFGLSEEGANVTIFNRTLDKAEELAKEFNCEAENIENIERVKDFDIIINATSVGMKPNENLTPISKEYLSRKQIIFDCVYNPLQTRLIKEAIDVGCRTILGIEMLLYQGVRQFEYYVDREAPVEVMREALIKNVK